MVTRYPTRLVEVTTEDGSESLRLITSPAHATDKYVALSYCWGQASTLRLEANNVSSLHKSIGIKALPQTIQDAISLTRYIGIRYLWVDALCIIQGRDKTALADWARESSRMHDVFGGAWLTIMAASGTSSDAGLFVNRPAQVDLCKQGARISVGSNKSEHAVLGPEPKTSALNQEPLGTRGWAFQEAILSSRQLIFGTSGMAWKCPSCECHENTNGPFLSKDVAELQSSRKEMALQLYEQWTEVVESYSKTQLTYKSDRLPAISGLAGIIREEMYSCMMRRYCFGLWRNDIIQQLMWRHDGCLVNGRREYDRQSEYRAPSWSWASVDGAVKFLKPDRLASSGGTVKWLTVWRSTIAFRGQMAHASSLRLQIRGQSTGLVETHEPWRHFDAYFDTYLDDLESIPETHKRLSGNGLHELIDVWLFFLNKSQGLILVDCGYDWVKWKHARDRMALFSKFQRIGVFTGSLSLSAWKIHHRTGRIV